MNQNEQLTSKAIEMQRTALENSQEAIEQAMELPVEQTLEFQKRAAQLFLDGLEMGSWAQNQGVELTRDAFSTYIDNMDDAVRDSTEFTEKQFQQATSAPRTQTAQPQYGAAETAQTRNPAPSPPQNAAGPNAVRTGNNGAAPAPNRHQPPISQPPTSQPPSGQPPTGQPQQSGQQYANSPATGPIQQPQRIQPTQQARPVPEPVQQSTPTAEAPAPQENPPRQTQGGQSTETESENTETPPDLP